MSSHPQDILSFGRVERTSPLTHERDVPAIVGANLKQLRRAHGYSLEKLAEISKVSRAMLGQIETGKSVPTITVLWKIADALEVPVNRLVQIDDTPLYRVLRRSEHLSEDGDTSGFTRRKLFEPWFGASSELYELRFDAGHREQFEAGASGRKQTLVVAVGELHVAIAEEPAVTLTAGDAIIFDLATAYTVANTSTESAVAYSALVNA